MSDGLSINNDRHMQMFMRMAATSKKTMPELWKQEAKICLGGTSGMPGVADITPPYSQASGRSSVQAEKMGKARVTSDIRSLYGTPSDAFDAIATRSQKQADAFWANYQQNDLSAASAILRANTGKSFSPFDGGSLHDRTAGGKKRRSQGRREQVFFVSDPAALDAYLKSEQSHVWWLASGWAEGLRALGARLPAGVKKLPAPGHLRVSITDAALEIAISNDVKFSGSIKDMKRGIETVFNTYRATRLDKMWDNYLAYLARETGLKKSA